MISMQHWHVDVPACDKIIGRGGEHRARRVRIAADCLPGWTYRLALRHEADGTACSLPLTAADGVLLWAELTRDVVRPGHVQAQICATKDGREKRSNIFRVYVADSIDAAPAPLPAGWAAVRRVVLLDRAEREALAERDENTLYLVRG